MKRWAGIRSALLLAAFACASGALAQEYTSDPVDAKARQYGARIKGLLQNPTEYATNKANFVEYFQKYYFPKMTQTNSEALATLGDDRFNLFQRVLWAATNNPQLQQDLTG